MNYTLKCEIIAFFYDKVNNNFSRESFSLFVQERIGINIFKKYNYSKGKSFKAFILNESNNRVITLSLALLEHYKYVSCMVHKKPFDKKVYTHLYNRLRQYHIGYFSNDYLLSTNVFNIDKPIHDDIKRLLISEKHKDSREIIGTMKDILEDVYIYILNKLGKSYCNSWDMKALKKYVFKALKLRDTTKNGLSSISCRILDNFTSIISNLVHLRNTYGTGHGKSPNGYTKIPMRYALLCINSTSIIIKFLIDKLNSIISLQGPSSKSDKNVAIYNPLLRDYMNDIIIYRNHPERLLYGDKNYWIKKLHLNGK